MELLPIFTLLPARTAISESQARSPPVPVETVLSAPFHKNSATETCQQLKWMNDLSYHLRCPNIWRSLK